MKRKGILILLAAVMVMSACKKKGCTDPTAINYNAEAEKDDGNCQFSTSATILPCQEFNTSGTSYELVDLGLDVDYIVECQMSVSCDLKIMPGVTIEFTTDAGFNVNSNGSLNAVATSVEPILFSGVDKAVGAWAGIFINSDDVKNKISGCSFEYAGGDYFNSNGDKGSIILYSGSKAEISENTIGSCASYGINCNYGGGDFIFDNNTISGCTMPMFTAAEYAGSISSGTFTGNATDVIFIDTYAGDGSISTNQTWTNLNVPYRIKGGGDMASNADWTIAPGVIIEFEQSVEVKINDGHSLKAVGTPSEHIVFRGVVQTQGAWERIKFWGTNVLNEIGYAEIHHGGEDPTNTKGSIYLWYGAKLNIHDVEFNDNAACGVYGKLSGGTTTNPNYSSSNLTFNNTPCTETFEN